MRAMLCALLLILSSTAALAQSERDGKDWNTRPEAWKYAYMTGILDGVTTGHEFTIPTLSKGSIVLYKEDKACLEKTQTTYDYNTSRFLFGLSLKDFVEGMDAFYKDPANVGIPVNRAIRVWAMQRKQIPEAAAILNGLRQEFAPGN